MLTNIKCEIQELFGGGKIDIDFNKINTYVGKNGTGKTVLLKLSWFGTYITSNKILEERGFLPQNCIQEDFVNHTISKVFDEIDFNGKMVFTFENNLAKIDYDKCTNCMTCVEKCPTKSIVDVTKQDLIENNIIAS